MPMHSAFMSLLVVKHSVYSGVMAGHYQGVPMVCIATAASHAAAVLAHHMHQ